MSDLKVGFIGYKGHAARLTRILEETVNVCITHFFHPDKEIDKSLLVLKDPAKVVVTRELSDLFSCDAIFIVAPNQTHYFYITELLKNFSGYIFCEKPPVASLEELNGLASLSEKDKGRIYFNFNLRFSRLFEILKNYPTKFNLGEPVKMSVEVGHGLGFKEIYKDSWRAKKETHRAGVLETLGIHYFDLASFVFGEPKKVVCDTAHFSPYGDSVDTCHLFSKFGNQSVLDLSCSYCVPCVEKVRVAYTNGFVEYDSGRVSVYGPRDVFDQKGFFASPPLIYQEENNGDELYLESLRKSCEYFVEHVYKKTPVEARLFDQSLYSNKVCLEAVNQ